MIECKVSVVWVGWVRWGREVAGGVGGAVSLQIVSVDEGVLVTKMMLCYMEGEIGHVLLFG